MRLLANRRTHRFRDHASESNRQQRVGHRRDSAPARLGHQVAVSASADTAERASVLTDAHPIVVAVITDQWNASIVAQPSSQRNRSVPAVDHDATSKNASTLSRTAASNSA